MTSQSSLISGFAAEALQTLTPGQIAFIRSLPKAELHAHLNGSIPISVLQELAYEYVANSPTDLIVPDVVQSGLARLQSSRGVQLTEIQDFFGLFPAIYALTSTPTALARATRAVLSEFLDGDHSQCSYLELRTTPRATAGMSRLEYMKTVLDEVERYPAERAAVIVSLDRRMEDTVVGECIRVATMLKEGGRRVVGVDLCGDPLAGDMDTFARHFAEAKEAGLSATLHIAETVQNSAKETLKLLSYRPNRIGHATFLDDEAKDIVLRNKICIEICLSSNLLCKTVGTLDDHHIQFYLKKNHPIAICTDDILPFRNSMLGEYALLMAQPPVGLGLPEDVVSRVARMSMECRFGLPNHTTPSPVQSRL